MSDRWGVPTLEEVARMPLAACDQDDLRLEKILGRKVTATEKSAAESMASEHASYGSTRFHLKTILPTNGPNHVKSVGSEAAVAVVYVNSTESIVIAVNSESHNGPSYVAPSPGAATGAGGNIRDNVAETASRPSAMCEARRQAHPVENPHHDPVLRHTTETTSGIDGYNNASGLPHGTGSVKYQTNFSGNNLVNVMCLTVAEKSRLGTNKVPVTDDPSKFVAIYVGKASDLTGLGGTKFASVAIDMTNTDLNRKAVQDPDPHLQEAVIRGLTLLEDRARAGGWKQKYSRKDMGAAGLLCSTIEQLHDTIGVVINGDLVPQNNPRTSLELLESETQERFFLYVHEDHVEETLAIFNNEIGLGHVNAGACAKVIGRCNNTGRYTFVRNGVVDVDAPVEHLSAGPLHYKAVKEPASKASPLPALPSIDRQINAVLNSINFKSDAFVHDHYDKHVQSTNIVNRGEGCAPLRTHELFEGEVGYSMHFDSNCVYGLLDPKFQAEDSFLRGAWAMAAVGASVIMVSNNANYGRTDVPEEMWAFVKGQEGIAKACNNWQIEDMYWETISKDPEIAAKMEKDPRRHCTVNGGNCSMNKANANTKTAIPPTTILGLVGWTPTPASYATWDLKPVESDLYLIGARQEHLGGTDLLQALNGSSCIGDKLFDIDYETSQSEVGAIISAVRSGYVSAANVIEEGGLCNALGEMVANTKYDVDVQINMHAKMGADNLTSSQKLFSESYGMVLQITPENKTEFLDLVKFMKIDVFQIGTVSSGKGTLTFNDGLSHVTPQQQLRSLYDNKLESMLNGVQHV